MHFKFVLYIDSLTLTIVLLCQHSVGIICENLVIAFNGYTFCINVKCQAKTRGYNDLKAFAKIKLVP